MGLLEHLPLEQSKMIEGWLLKRGRNVLWKRRYCKVVMLLIFLAFVLPFPAFFIFKNFEPLPCLSGDGQHDACV